MSGAGYQQGAQLVYEVVGRFKIFGSGVPEFLFPPKGVALLASLKDVGANLANNDAARDLLAGIFADWEARELADWPTAMMLQVCLEAHEIPIKRVPFEELGLRVSNIYAGRE
jgi:hypothetical protein